MKFWVLTFFVLTQLSSLSQSDCLQIKSEDDKPVPYATISVKKKNKILIADSVGNVCGKRLQKLENGDSIFISAIGYEEYVSKFSGETIIRLKKRIVVLPEVIAVNGKGGIEEWGTKKNPSVLFGYCGRWSFREILNSTARIIYPEGDYKKAEIVSVSFYDETGKGMDVPVRIRVYLIGKDSLPYADYLNDNLIVNTKGKGWLKVNLEDKELVFPKEGLAFGIELFSNREEDYYYETQRDKNGNKYEARVYGFSLGMETEEVSTTLMKFNIWNPWRVERAISSRMCGNLVCRVKVRVWR